MRSLVPMAIGAFLLIVGVYLWTDDLPVSAGCICVGTVFSLIGCAKLT